MSVKKLLYGAITKKNTTAITSYTTNINTTASTAVETSINTTWQTSWMSGPTTTASTTYNSTWTVSYSEIVPTTQTSIATTVYSDLWTNRIAEYNGEKFLDTNSLNSSWASLVNSYRPNIGHNMTMSQLMEAIGYLVLMMKAGYQGLKWYPDANNPNEPDTGHPDYANQYYLAISKYVAINSNITLANGSIVKPIPSLLPNIREYCKVPTVQSDQGWTFDGYRTCSIKYIRVSFPNTYIMTGPTTTYFKSTSAAVTKNTSWTTGGTMQAKNTSMVTLGQVSRNTTKITLGNTSHSTTWSTSF